MTNENNATPTPLPWRQVIILLIMRLADPLSFTILFPFVYFMVKDFHLTSDDAEVGFYVGFIASSFALSQMLSVVPWGIVSDRIGRRPVILTGLLGTASSLFLFGLSKSLAWAIVTRSMCGLLSGNVGVIKTTMAELTDDSNRAQGFSLMPMMFGLGTIIGPTLGGFLSNPMDKYAEFFGEGVVGSFLRDYPYFLPCGLSSMLIFSSFLFGLFFLEETLEPVSPVLNEATPLLTNSDGGIASSGSAISQFLDRITIESKNAIVSFSFQSFLSVIQAELFPIWAATPLMLGGLGFDTSDIGLVMSFGGVALLFIQIFIYPSIQRKLGTLFLYQKAFLFYIPVILAFPFVAMIESESLSWIILLFLIIARTACNVIAVTSINLLIVDSCPDKRLLGKVNGLALASSSLVRSIGPTLCGIVYSWSLTNEYSFFLLKAPLTWILLAFIAFLTHLSSRRLTIIKPNN